MKSWTDLNRVWPENYAELRKSRNLAAIRKEARMNVINGKDRYMLWEYMVHNDYLSVAIVKMAVGAYADPQEFDGDMLIMPLNADLVVRVPKPEFESDDDALFSSFEVMKGEKLYLPAHTYHQFINFEAIPLEIYVAISNWKEESPAK